MTFPPHRYHHWILSLQHLSMHLHTSAAIEESLGSALDDVGDDFFSLPTSLGVPEASAPTRAAFQESLGSTFVNVGDDFSSLLTSFDCPETQAETPTSFISSLDAELILNSSYPIPAFRTIYTINGTVDEMQYEIYIPPSSRYPTYSF